MVTEERERNTSVICQLTDLEGKPLASAVYRPLRSGPKEVTQMVNQLLQNFGDLEKEQLGLGHSYNRANVNFNVNRVDNMVIQAIFLLDTLDKDANTFAMRVRDATDEFEDAGHSENARELMKGYCIGELDTPPVIPELDIILENEEQDITQKLREFPRQYYVIPVTVYQASKYNFRSILKSENSQ